MEEFRAPIAAADRGGAYVVVPPDVVDALGGGGRIPVHATFDGIEYRGSVASMGGEKVLGVLKAIREQLGKGPGDDVVVTLARDDAPPYSHQREYVEWVDEAKRGATRVRQRQVRAPGLRRSDRTRAR
jgi:hypothetical protein